MRAHSPEQATPLLKACCDLSLSPAGRVGYRGTLLIRKRTPLVPYSMTMPLCPRAYGGPRGVAVSYNSRSLARSWDSGVAGAEGGKRHQTPRAYLCHLLEGEA